MEAFFICLGCIYLISALITVYSYFSAGKSPDDDRNF